MLKEKLLKYNISIKKRKVLVVEYFDFIIIYFYVCKNIKINTKVLCV